MQISIESKMTRSGYMGLFYRNRGQVIIMRAGLELITDNVLNDETRPLRIKANE